MTSCSRGLAVSFGLVAGGGDAVEALNVLLLKCVEEGGASLRYEETLVAAALIIFSL